MPVTATLRRIVEPVLIAGEGEPVRHQDEEPAPHFLVPAIPINGFVPDPPSPGELQLAQRIFFLSGEKLPRVVVFCGVQAGDAAAALCARTAEVLSCLVKETICVMDADLHAPTLHLRYELDAPVRGREIKRGAGEDDGPLRGPNLWILPASELKECRAGLAPNQLRHRMEMLRERFGFLLICAPPLSTAAEGFLLGQMADGVVMSVLAHSTRRALAIKARADLELYKIRLLGTVFHEPAPAKRRAAR